MYHNFHFQEGQVNVLFTILPTKFTNSLYIRYKNKHKKTLKGREKKSHRLETLGFKEQLSIQFSGFSFRLIHSSVGAKRANNH